MDISDEVFKQEYIIPAEFLIREDWEQIIWDETLKRAHTQGKMPVGSIMITHEPGPDALASQIQPDGSLIEHVPMIPVPFDMAMVDSVGKRPTVKITAEVMVGVSL